MQRGLAHFIGNLANMKVIFLGRKRVKHVEVNPFRARIVKDSCKYKGEIEYAVPGIRPEFRSETTNQSMDNRDYPIKVPSLHYNYFCGPCSFACCHANEIDAW